VIYDGLNVVYIDISVLSEQLKRVGRKYKEQAESTQKEFEDHKAKQQDSEKTQQQIQVCSLFKPSNRYTKVPCSNPAQQQT
jgi:hypothetical protein